MLLYTPLQTESVAFVTYPIIRKMLVLNILVICVELEHRYDYIIPIHPNTPAVYFVVVLCQAMMHCSILGEINISSLSRAWNKTSQMLKHTSLVEQILQRSGINDVIIVKQMGKYLGCR